MPMLAQEQADYFETSIEPAGVFFRIKLMVDDLPNNTWIVSRLLFENEPIPNAQKDYIIRSNRVIAIYGPIAQQIPSGKYVWEFVLLSKHESKYFPYRKEFYQGTSSQQRLETRAWSKFYYESALNLRDFAIELQETKLATDPTKRLAQWQSWQDRFVELKAKIEAYENQFWFAPDFTSSEDLRQTLGFVETILTCIAARSYRELKVAIPKDWLDKCQRLDDAQIALYPNRAYQSILTLYQKMVARLALPMNLKEQSIEQDLSWFNQLFQQFRTQSSIFLSNPEITLEEWQKQFSQFQDQTKVFELQILDYQKSPLPGKYPKLNQQLTGLLTNWKEFIAIVNAQIQKQRGVPAPQSLLQKDPQKNIEEMQKITLELLELPKIAQENEAKAKKAALQIMIQHGRQFIQYYAELQKGLAIKELKAFQEWNVGWKTQLESMRVNYSNWRKLNPELARDYHIALVALLTRANLELRRRQGIDDESPEEQMYRIERADAHLTNFFSSLDAKLQALSADH